MRGVASLPRPGAARTLDAETILTAFPLAIVALDASDRVVFSNRAAHRFFSVDPRRLQASRLTDFLSEDDHIEASIVSVRRTKSTLVLHGVTLENPRLRRASVEVTLAPLAELAGGVVLGFRAVPGGQENEARVRECARIAQVLAHEVKNPLSGIRGAAQLLEASLVGQDRDLASLIRGEVDRIGALIDRLTLPDAASLTRSAVNIHEVLRHVGRLAEQGFAHRVRVREEYDPSLPPALGDRDQLVQAFLNLVKNAAEATPAANGEVTLRSAFVPGVARITAGARRALPIMVGVRDNGGGIPEAVRASLFAPCVSKKPGGSGLGLAVVATIVDAHEGLIEVESHPGRTEFRVYLPAAEARGIP